MQGYCDIFSKDYFEADVDRSTCLHATSLRVKADHVDVSNVIYHKFSHGAVSYTLNGENVNVMLESRHIEQSNAVVSTRTITKLSYFLKFKYTKKINVYVQIKEKTEKKRFSNNISVHCKKIRRFYGKIPGIWLPDNPPVKT